MKKFIGSLVFVSIFLSIVFAGTTPARADELHKPESELLRMGYFPFDSFKHYRGSVRVQSDLPLNLPWPVVFQDAAHTIAQNYVNFQDYGDGAYYHKGCDLRSDAGSWVTAPITGILEGGYYSYATQADGSEKKMWKPWTGQPHSDPYFELALTTQDGYRFELHHVNSMNLPSFTIDALNKGNVVVQAGTQIGHVLPWPDGVYNHIHYNIFRQDGVIENPEFYSTATPIPDHTPPTVYGVYGIRPDQSTVALSAGGMVQGPLTEIVVATTETRDNNVYVQTPPFLGIKFAGGASFVWDFRHFLLGPDGKWPDIRRVFLPSLKIPGGKSLSTFGQYGKGLFLMRLPIPAGAQGKFDIRDGDTAGNYVDFEGTLQ